MKCETCIPLINCDFFRTNFDDAVVEQLMIACLEDARLLACDVLDAACDLRDRGVNLSNRGGSRRPLCRWQRPALARFYRARD
jgi:hypothetical protein